MFFIAELQGNLVFLLICAAFLGLVVGSFLNVVIHRLPQRLEQAWIQHCRETLELEQQGVIKTVPSIFWSRSQCPRCDHSIGALENIPILSFLFLRGRCAHCHAPISWRYPIVEAVTACFTIIVVWHFGLSTTTIWATILTWGLIALSVIDFDHQILPDVIVLPGIWVGLIINSFNTFATPEDAIIGAVAGYLSLWLVYQVFRKITGKEGMGYGDFKLLALFGAWFGWQFLPLIILLSAFTGALIGIGAILILRRDKNLPIPFGPFLAMAGWIAMLWGDELINAYLQVSGIG